MRTKLAWLANIRPDCLFEISELAQMTEEMFNSDKKKLVRQLNRAVGYADENRISMKISKLNLSSLKDNGFCDSSFASNQDLSSQLG